jgi:23S rRNA (cytosine1962-C5)-methyltransferase
MEISARAALRLRAGHVWVYASELSPAAAAAPGSLVYVKDNRGKTLGSALYSSASQIALRMVADETLRDEAELLTLLRQRVRTAVEYRTQLGLLRDQASNACRILYSEADGLPGIIADRYHNILSLQTLTQAMDRTELKQAIMEELRIQLQECGIESVVERTDARIREL